MGKWGARTLTLARHVGCERCKRDASADRAWRILGALFANRDVPQSGGANERPCPSRATARTASCLGWQTLIGMLYMPAEGQARACRHARAKCLVFWRCAPKAGVAKIGGRKVARRRCALLALPRFKWPRQHPARRPPRPPRARPRVPRRPARPSAARPSTCTSTRCSSRCTPVRCPRARAAPCTHGPPAPHTHAPHTQLTPHAPHAAPPAPALPRRDWHLQEGHERHELLCQ